MEIRPFRIQRIRKLRISESKSLENSEFRMGLGIPPFKTKNMFESNPLKTILLVRGLTASNRTLASP